MERKDFYLEQYVEDTQKILMGTRKQTGILDKNYFEFKELCEQVKNHFNDKVKKDSEDMLEYQKKAILGYQKQVNYFLELIEEFLKENNKSSVPYPPWYASLSEGIFHERWGLAGIHTWFSMESSSSCKIVGKRIYFMVNGKQQLQEQSFSEERLKQLKKALILGTPEKRLNEKYHEVYMVDGTRIQIFNAAKEVSIVFRKYVIDTYTFDQQARLETIDPLMIPLLESMVECGFNVAFTGPVRTGKTTFLTTYQSYEDPTLEGVMVETDPEIPLHIIMPTAPIIQLLADDEELDKVLKPMMRSDGDYLIMAEARDGRSLNVAVEITKKGTRRVKMSFHTGNATNFCFDVAQLISKELGGDVWANMIQVAEGFNYVFSFQQLSHDKSKKKLKGIYEIRFDPESLLISSHQICKYNYENNNWEYKYDIGERLEEIGTEESVEAIKKFKEILKKLSEEKPMQGNHVKISPYSKLMSPMIKGA